MKIPNGFSWLSIGEDATPEREARACSKVAPRKPGRAAHMSRPPFAVGSDSRLRVRLWASRPFPVRYLGHIFPVLANIEPMVRQTVAKALNQMTGERCEPGNAPDHVYREMKSVDFVQYAHIEWRCGRTFLFIATNMQALIHPFICESVDQPWIAMIGEDDRLILREQSVKVGICQAVWML